MRLPVRRLIPVLVPVAACASIAAGLTAFGCSLGLDPSLIGQQDAAAVSDAEGPDGAPPSDAGDAKAPPVDAGKSDAPISVDAGACNTNADCQAAAAGGGSCVTSATCDTTSHTCSLVVCGNSANCQAEVCQPSQTCTLPASYGFAPASFQVTTGGIGGFGVQYSIAAAWPFVFVVTNNGVTAYNVVDPTNNTPPVVPLQGVPFIPVATLAVGRRVYFITGIAAGSGPTTFRQAIAWVDVPQNPLLTTLQATPAFVSTPDNPLVNVFSNNTNGLFFLYGGAMLEPAANVAPPLDSTTTLTPWPNTGLPNGAGIVASTGGRLLSYRYDATNPNLPFPHFAFINKPGTSSATTTPEVSLNQFGGLDNQWGFATGVDGSVLWETAVLDELDSGGNDGVARARLSWLVDSATAANVDTTSYVDLATYSPAVGGQLVGQPAWIDANTALGFASLSSIQTNTTLAQVVYKTPASIDPVRNTQLGVPPGAIGTATSNGFGYALLQNDPLNRSCTVQILAPSCGGADQ
jgi:hypothetical protein